MQIIRAKESDAAKREIAWEDIPGLTFARDDVQLTHAPLRGFRAGRGHVEERGDGIYVYTLHPLEVENPGKITIMIAGSHSTQLEIVEAFDLRGQIWFTTAPERVRKSEGVGQFLDDFGLSMGIARAPGESDNSMRERIAIGLQFNTTGTRTAIESAVLNVAGVISCDITEVPDGLASVYLVFRVVHVRMTAIARRECDRSVRLAIGMSVSAGFDWRLDMFEAS
jgi:hypothetical protein